MNPYNTNLAIWHQNNEQANHGLSSDISFAKIEFLGEELHPMALLFTLSDSG